MKGLAEYDAYKTLIVNKDINNDKNIDGKDATHLLQVLAGWYDEEKENNNAKNPNIGNVNNDKKIDEVDAGLVARYAASYITNITATDELKITNARLKGQADVNFDGKVNIKDVRIIYEYANKWILFGDVNQDEKITSDDAAKIMNIVNKKEKTDSLTLALADYDCNGKVNKADAIAVLKISKN